MHDLCSDIFDGDQGAEARGKQLQKIQEYNVPAYTLETELIVHLDHISMRQRYLEGSK